MDVDPSPAHSHRSRRSPTPTRDDYSKFKLRPQGFEDMRPSGSLKEMNKLDAECEKAQFEANLIKFDAPRPGQARAGFWQVQTYYKPAVV